MIVVSRLTSLEELGFPLRLPVSRLTAFHHHPPLRRAPCPPAPGTASAGWRCSCAATSREGLVKLCTITCMITQCNGEHDNVMHVQGAGPGSVRTACCASTTK